MPTLNVVIPFYNEPDTLAGSVARVLEAPLPRGWAPRIVLVDDHSNETSRAAAAALAGDLQRRRVRFELLRHEVNRGKGAALQTGFDAVLSSGPAPGDLIVIHDADLEYDPADFHDLMGPLLAGEADAVVGSRWHARRLTGLWRRFHAGVNRFLTVLSNMMTGYRLTDMECCYKMMSVELLRRVRPRLSEARYGIEPQLVAALAAVGARVVEVPVSYDPRTVAQGKKIRWVDGIRAIYVIARERFRGARFQHRPT